MAAKGLTDLQSVVNGKRCRKASLSCQRVFLPTTAGIRSHDRGQVPHDRRVNAAVEDVAAHLDTEALSKLKWGSSKFSQHSISYRMFQAGNNAHADLEGPHSNGAHVSGYNTDDDFLEVQGIQVHVRNVTKTYESKGKMYRALDGINLDILSGQMVALLGPSGSGKTTLLRMIAGLDTVSEGQILFDDEDVGTLPVQKRGVGFMFQSFALFKHMTVGENIAFGPRIQKQKVDLERRVLQLLDLIDLKGYGARFPAQLSGGQRQRVALARALAVNPRILLLDEPFGALDPEVKREVRRGVRDIIQRVGLTSIFVTHDRDEAFDIADKIVVFNRGQIQQIGTAKEIQDKPATPFVASFLADINKFPSNCQEIKILGSQPFMIFVNFASVLAIVVFAYPHFQQMMNTVVTFVKRMGLRTHKSKAMCLPQKIHVETEVPEFLRNNTAAKPFSPATVLERKDVGDVMKYWVKFDDGVDAEVHVPGLRDERYVDLDLQQRIYLHLPKETFMPFFEHELESYPIPLNIEEASMKSAQL